VAVGMTPLSVEGQRPFSVQGAASREVTKCLCGLMSISGLKMFPLLDNWLVCPRSPQAFKESFKVFQALGFWIREKSTLQCLELSAGGEAVKSSVQLLRGCDVVLPSDSRTLPVPSPNKCVLQNSQEGMALLKPQVVAAGRGRSRHGVALNCSGGAVGGESRLTLAPLFSLSVAQKVVALRKKQQLSIGPCKSLPNSPSHSSVSAASIPSVHINQASNGSGAFSDYSSSVPSTPSIGQRELRIETIAASNTPTPIRKQSKRRSNIFTICATVSNFSSTKRPFQLLPN
ncbi:unnamed protein product, partial [Natator depressus]